MHRRARRPMMCDEPLTADHWKELPERAIPFFAGCGDLISFRSSCGFLARQWRLISNGPPAPRISHQTISIRYHVVASRILGFGSNREAPLPRGTPATSNLVYSVEHFPYTARRRWHIDVAQFNTTVESVDDSVDDRRRGTDGASLTRTLDAQRVGRRRHVVG